MSVLDTQHKRKSAAITAVILILFILGIFNFGMQYIDPPEEYGVAINFGDMNVGSGVSLLKSQKTIPKEVLKTPAVTSPLKEVAKEPLVEKIITEETTKEVPIVKKVAEKKQTLVQDIVQKEAPKVVAKQKPSKESLAALNKLLNGNLSDGKPKGEGDDTADGIKGDKQGEPISSKYYGNRGSGTGGNYNLAGRKVLSTPKRQPDCQEEGVVVVLITVAKNGKVVRAIPGEKGSTNTAPCLKKAAKEAALSTIWNSDGAAPEIQTGTIIYKFSLSK
ncbi:energy transducer TonB [Polaribacter sp.]|nr:energy transducer TonB [Polaribacter sp.]